MIIFGSGGVPTKPDVDKLVARFGAPTVGSMVLYADIAECIGVAKGTCRFSSVVGAWRKQLQRSNNVVFVAVKNEGYEVADNKTRVNVSVGGYKSGLRKVMRSGNIAATTDSDGLTASMIRARDHVVNIAAKFKLAAQLGARETVIPVPQIKQNGS